MKLRFIISTRVLYAALLLSSTSMLLQVDAANSSAAGPPTTTLCSVVNPVTSLRVSRGIPLNPTHFTFPRLVLVKRESPTRKVAEALCRLPTAPSGPMSCPADFGFDYRLTLTAPGYDVANVRLDPTGCEEVSGLGAVRWVEQSPQFFQLLGAAMQLKYVTQSTFRGTIVNS